MAPPSEELRDDLHRQRRRGFPYQLRADRTDIASGIVLACPAGRDRVSVDKVSGNISTRRVAVANVTVPPQRLATVQRMRRQTSSSTMIVTCPRWSMPRY